MEWQPFSRSDWRIVVDLDTLEKAMSSCCKCRRKLELRDITGIKCKLMGTVALVQCTNEECLAANEILTTAQSTESSSVEPVIDEDFQLGLTMSGVTVDQAKILLSALRIPYVVPKLSQPSLKLEGTDDDQVAQPREIPKDQPVTSQDSHDTANHQCNQCNKRFSSSFNLKRHTKMIHSSNGCVCRYCGKQYASMVSLNDHQKVMHLGVKYQCDLCGKQYKSQAGINSHNREHQENFKYFCDVCGLGFVYKSKYLCHISKHNTEKQYQCTICANVFQHISSLKQHQEICGLKKTNIRSFHCKYCSKTFIAKRYMQAHVNYAHTKPNSYPCTVCGKMYARKSSVMAHIKRKHEEENVILPNIGNESKDLSKSLRGSDSGDFHSIHIKVEADGGVSL